jgi:hypothetical protein
VTLQPPATSPPPPPPSGFTPIRINTGGSAYTDPAGQVWAADTGYTGGITYTTASAISNTTSGPLYQSLRWNYGSLQYRFAIPNGTYSVRLKFAETTWSAAGQRIFNIAVNGQLVEANFDVVAAAGGPNRALDRTYTASVVGGQIAIDLTGVRDNPIVNGIEITASSATTPPPTTPPPGFTPIRINTGGSAYTDPAGQVWAADTGYTGGITYTTTSAIANTTSGPLYQSLRWNYGSLQYRFTVPNGTYDVRLKFAETTWTAAGQRIFNIAVNGQIVQSNFDVVAAAGGANRAVDRTYAVNVTGGQIAIDLTGVKDNPIINAIEVTASGTVTPPPTTPPAGFTPIRVNTGGSAYTDPAGQVWAADTGYIGGITYTTTSAIGNTTSDPLYQSLRWNYGSLQYRFTIPNGTYSVRLKFAEPTWTAAGQRMFNIAVNGQTVEANFDPVAAAGGGNRAVDRTYTVNVSGGQVAIDLTGVKDNPFINAIEITAGVTAAAFTPLRVNSGGSTYTDPAGQVWAADTGYTGGITYTTSSAIANTTTAPLYQSLRWNYGSLQYRFTVPNGAYSVRLKFAEPTWGTVGQRIFNITVNGQTVEANFDIVAAAGGSNRAVDRTYTVSVTGGQVAIDLTGVRDNPVLNAIEITAP